MSDEAIRAGVVLLLCVLGLGVAAVLCAAFS